MRKLFLALILLLSCIGVCCGPTIAGLSLGPANIAVPPIRPGTNPTKWEYVCFEDDQYVSIAKKANALGSAGFELSGAARERSATTIWCFKRRLP